MKQRQKKEAVINSVQANDNRFSREKARRDQSSISIMGNKHPKCNPHIIITSEWRDAEPNLAFLKLLRLLLSPQKRGGG